MHGRSLALMLSVMYGSAFMAGFGENLMNMALVSIMAEYGVDSVTAQWLVTGYMIVSTIMVTLAAFLYRRIKLRTLFFSAAALFLAGSVMGLLSSSFAMLFAARLIQSAGSGMFIPMMMNTVLAVTPKNKLGSYMSIGGCMITFGPAFAPVVCGAVVTTLGWHCIFLIPIIAIIALSVMGAAFLRNLDNEPESLDVPSVLLSAIGLTVLSYGLAEVALNTLVGIVALAAAALIIGLFVVRQLRCAHPLMDLTPMKSRTFWPATILVLIAMMSTFSTTVLLPLYLEGALGMTAATAGFVILVPVLVNAATALFSGRIMDSRGEWPLIPLGFCLIVAGFAILSATSALMSVPAVVVGALCVFIGVGMTLTPSQTAGLRTLPPNLNPFGVSIMTTFVQLAACIGPSLFTGVMSSGQAAALLDNADAALANAQGFSLAMLLAAVIALAGTLVAFVYARAAVRRDAEQAAESTRGTHPASGLAAIMETQPYTITASSPVSDAMSVLVDKRIGGMPIVDEQGNPAGFISDGDIMRYLADKHPLITGSYSMIQAANDGSFDERLRELMGLPVSTIATRKLVTIEAHCSLEEACTLLSQHKLKKVPVVENGRIVGTLNRSDVIRYAMEEALRTA